MNPIPSMSPVAMPMVNDPRINNASYSVNNAMAANQQQWAQTPTNAGGRSFNYGVDNTTANRLAASQPQWTQTPTYPMGNGFNYGGGMSNMMPNYYGQHPFGPPGHMNYMGNMGGMAYPGGNSFMPGMLNPGFLPHNTVSNNTLGSMSGYGYGWNSASSNPLASSTSSLTSQAALPTPQAVTGLTANRLQTTGMPAALGPAVPGGLATNTAPLSAKAGNQLNLMA